MLSALLGTSSASAALPGAAASSSFSQQQQRILDSVFNDALDRLLLEATKHCYTRTGPLRNHSVWMLRLRDAVQLTRTTATATAMDLFYVFVLAAEVLHHVVYYDYSAQEDLRHEKEEARLPPGSTLNVLRSLLIQSISHVGKLLSLQLVPMTSEVIHLTCELIKSIAFHFGCKPKELRGPAREGYHRQTNDLDADGKSGVAAAAPPFRYALTEDPPLLIALLQLLSTVAAGASAAAAAAAASSSNGRSARSSPTSQHLPSWGGSEGGAATGAPPSAPRPSSAATQHVWWTCLLLWQYLLPPPPYVDDTQQQQQPISSCSSTASSSASGTRDEDSSSSEEEKEEEEEGGGRTNASCSSSSLSRRRGTSTRNGSTASQRQGTHIGIGIDSAGASWIPPTPGAGNGVYQHYQQRTSASPAPAAAPLAHRLYGREICSAILAEAIMEAVQLLARAEEEGSSPTAGAGAGEVDPSPHAGGPSPLSQQQHAMATAPVASGGGRQAPRDLAFRSLAQVRHTYLFLKDVCCLIRGASPIPATELLAAACGHYPSAPPQRTVRAPELYHAHPYAVTTWWLPPQCRHTALQSPGTPFHSAAAAHRRVEDVMRQLVERSREHTGLAPSAGTMRSESTSAIGSASPSFSGGTEWTSAVLNATGVDMVRNSSNYSFSASPPRLQSPGSCTTSALPPMEHGDSPHTSAFTELLSSPTSIVLPHRHTSTRQFGQNSNTTTTTTTATAAPTSAVGGVDDDAAGRGHHPRLVRSPASISPSSTEPFATPTRRSSRAGAALNSSHPHITASSTASAPHVAGVAATAAADAPTPTLLKMSRVGSGASPAAGGMGGGGAALSRSSAVFPPSVQGTAAGLGMSSLAYLLVETVLDLHAPSPAAERSSDLGLQEASSGATTGAFSFEAAASGTEGSSSPHCHRHHQHYRRRTFGVVPFAFHAVSLRLLLLDALQTSLEDPTVWPGASRRRPLPGPTLDASTATQEVVTNLPPTGFLFAQFLSEDVLQVAFRMSIHPSGGGGGGGGPVDYYHPQLFQRGQGMALRALRRSLPSTLAALVALLHYHINLCATVLSRIPSAAEGSGPPLPLRAPQDRPAGGPTEMAALVGAAREIMALWRREVFTSPALLQHLLPIQATVLQDRRPRGGHHRHTQQESERAATSLSQPPPLPRSSSADPTPQWEAEDGPRLYTPRASPSPMMPRHSGGGPTSTAAAVPPLSISSLWHRHRRKRTEREEMMNRSCCSSSSNTRRRGRGGGVFHFASFAAHPTLSGAILGLCIEGPAPPTPSSSKDDKEGYITPFIPHHSSNSNSNSADGRDAVAGTIPLVVVMALVSAAHGARLELSYDHPQGRPHSPQGMDAEAAAPAPPVSVAALGALSGSLHQLVGSYLCASQPASQRSAVERVLQAVVDVFRVVSPLLRVAVPLAEEEASRDAARRHHHWIASLSRPATGATGAEDHPQRAPRAAGEQKLEQSREPRLQRSGGGEEELGEESMRLQGSAQWWEQQRRSRIGHPLMVDVLHLLLAYSQLAAIGLRLAHLFAPPESPAAAALLHTSRPLTPKQQQQQKRREASATTVALYRSYESCLRWLAAPLRPSAGVSGQLRGEENVFSLASSFSTPARTGSALREPEALLVSIALCNTLKEAGLPARVVGCYAGLSRGSGGGGGDFSGGCAAAAAAAAATASTSLEAQESARRMISVLQQARQMHPPPPQADNAALLQAELDPQGDTLAATAATLMNSTASLIAGRGRLAQSGAAATSPTSSDVSSSPSLTSPLQSHTTVPHFSRLAVGAESDSMVPHPAAAADKRAGGGRNVVRRFLDTLRSQSRSSEPPPPPPHDGSADAAAAGEAAWQRGGGAALARQTSGKAGGTLIPAALLAAASAQHTQLLLRGLQAVHHEILALEMLMESVWAASVEIQPGSGAGPALPADQMAGYTTSVLVLALQRLDGLLAKAFLLCAAVDRLLAQQGEASSSLSTADARRAMPQQQRRNSISTNSRNRPPLPSSAAAGGGGGGGVSGAQPQQHIEELQRAFQELHARSNRIQHLLWWICLVQVQRYIAVENDTDTRRFSPSGDEGSVPPDRSDGPQRGGGGGVAAYAAFLRHITTALFSSIGAGARSGGGSSRAPSGTSGHGRRAGESEVVPPTVSTIPTAPGASPTTPPHGTRSRSSPSTSPPLLQLQQRRFFSLCTLAQLPVWRRWQELILLVTLALYQQLLLMSWARRGAAAASLDAALGRAQRTYESMLGVTYEVMQALQSGVLHPCTLLMLSSELVDVLDPSPVDPAADGLEQLALDLVAPLGIDAWEQGEGGQANEKHTAAASSSGGKGSMRPAVGGRLAQPLSAEDEDEDDPADYEIEKGARDNHTTEEQQGQGGQSGWEGDGAAGGDGCNNAPSVSAATITASHDAAVGWTVERAIALVLLTASLQPTGALRHLPIQAPAGPIDAHLVVSGAPTQPDPPLPTGIAYFGLPPAAVSSEADDSPSPIAEQWERGSGSLPVLAELFRPAQLRRGLESRLVDFIDAVTVAATLQTRWRAAAMSAAAPSASAATTTSSSSSLPSAPAWIESFGGSLFGRWRAAHAIADIMGLGATRFCLLADRLLCAPPIPVALSLRPFIASSPPQDLHTPADGMQAAPPTLAPAWPSSGPLHELQLQLLCQAQRSEVVSRTLARLPVAASNGAWGCSFCAPSGPTVQAKQLALAYLFRAVTCTDSRRRQSRCDAELFHPVEEVMSYLLHQGADAVITCGCPEAKARRRWLLQQQAEHVAQTLQQRVEACRQSRQLRLKAPAGVCGALAVVVGSQLHRCAIAVLHSFGESLEEREVWAVWMKALYQTLDPAPLDAVAVAVAGPALSGSRAPKNCLEAARLLLHHASDGQRTAPVALGMRHLPAPSRPAWKLVERSFRAVEHVLQNSMVHLHNDAGLMAELIRCQGALVRYQETTSFLCSMQYKELAPGLPTPEMVCAEVTPAAGTGEATTAAGAGVLEDANDPLAASGALSAPQRLHLHLSSIQMLWSTADYLSSLFSNTSSSSIGIGVGGHVVPSGSALSPQDLFELWALLLQQLHEAAHRDPRRDVRQSAMASLCSLWRVYGCAGGGGDRPSAPAESSSSQQRMAGVGGPLSRLEWQLHQQLQHEGTTSVFSVRTWVWRSMVMAPCVELFAAEHLFTALQEMLEEGATQEEEKETATIELQRTREESSFLGLVFSTEFSVTLPALHPSVLMGITQAETEMWREVLPTVVQLVRSTATNNNNNNNNSRRSSSGGRSLSLALTAVQKRYVEAWDVERHTSSDTATAAEGAEQDGAAEIPSSPSPPPALSSYNTFRYHLVHPHPSNNSRTTTNSLLPSSSSLLAIWLSLWSAEGGGYTVAPLASPLLDHARVEALDNISRLIVESYHHLPYPVADGGGGQRGEADALHLTERASAVVCFVYYCQSVLLVTPRILAWREGEKAVNQTHTAPRGKRREEMVPLAAARALHLLLTELRPEPALGKILLQVVEHITKQAEAEEVADASRSVRRAVHQEAVEEMLSVDVCCELLDGVWGYYSNPSTESCATDVLSSCLPRLLTSVVAPLWRAPAVASAYFSPTPLHCAVWDHLWGWLYPAAPAETATIDDAPTPMELDAFASIFRDFFWRCVIPAQWYTHQLQPLLLRQFSAMQHAGETNGPTNSDTGGTPQPQHVAVPASLPQHMKGLLPPGTQLPTVISALVVLRGALALTSATGERRTEVETESYWKPPSARRSEEKKSTGSQQLSYRHHRLLRCTSSVPPKPGHLHMGMLREIPGMIEGVGQLLLLAVLRVAQPGAADATSAALSPAAPPQGSHNTSSSSHHGPLGQVAGYPPETLFAHSVALLQDGLHQLLQQFKAAVATCGEGEGAEEGEDVRLGRVLQDGVRALCLTIFRLLDAIVVACEAFRASLQHAATRSSASTCSDAQHSRPVVFTLHPTVQRILEALLRSLSTVLLELHLLSQQQNKKAMEGASAIQHTTGHTAASMVLHAALVEVQQRLLSTPAPFVSPQALARTPGLEEERQRLAEVWQQMDAPGLLARRSSHMDPQPVGVSPSQPYHAAGWPTRIHNDPSSSSSSSLPGATPLTAPAGTHIASSSTSGGGGGGSSLSERMHMAYIQRCRETLRRFAALSTPPGAATRPPPQDLYVLFGEVGEVLDHLMAQSGGEATALNAVTVLSLLPDILCCVHVTAAVHANGPEEAAALVEEEARLRAKLERALQLAVEMLRCRQAL